METIKESKSIVKRFLERRRNIRKEMTKLGRVFDSITMIFMFIMLIFIFGAFELGFDSLVLIFIIILPSLYLSLGYIIKHQRSIKQK